MREESEKNREGAARENGKATKYSYFKSIVRPFEALIEHYKRKGKEERAYRKWEKKWRRWEVFGLWAAAAVGAAAIYKGSVDSGRQLTEMQAEQRPWIAFAGPPCIAQKGHDCPGDNPNADHAFDVSQTPATASVVATFNFQNGGKSPATNLYIKFAWCLSQSEPKDFIACEAIEKKVLPVSGDSNPDRPLGMWTPGTSGPIWREFSPEEVTKIRRRTTERLFVVTQADFAFGDVQYRTVFRQEYAPHGPGGVYALRDYAGATSRHTQNGEWVDD